MPAAPKRLFFDTLPLHFGFCLTLLSLSLEWFAAQLEVEDGRNLASMNHLITAWDRAPWIPLDF